MTTSGFALTHLFAAGLPAPTPRWAGFPKYNFIGGHNAPERIPVDGLAAAAGAALQREGASLALYNANGPQGLVALREVVARKAKARGIEVTAEEVLITSGSSQGIDLVNRLLLNRGDSVVIEEFTYAGALARLARLGVNVLAAPLDGDGLKIEALAEILRDTRRRGVTPKYIYTIPTIQNPTGSILPRERREALLVLSREYGVPIFEDECYADLTFEEEAPPALLALDRSHVLHIGSFSKTLSPALRLGYVIADPELLGRLVAMKREVDGGTGALDQMVAAEYFAHHFRPHVRALTATLREKLETMVETVNREFGTAVEMWRPQGGIFLWLKFPDAVDVRRLLAPAEKAGIAFNPGPDWAATGEAAKSFMRLCFAFPSKEAIRDGVAALARVSFEETGIPERSANIRRAEGS
jgi:2-aminoadipate transaminase